MYVCILNKVIEYYVVCTRTGIPVRVLQYRYARPDLPAQRAVMSNDPFNCLIVIRLGMFVDTRYD